MTPELLVLIFLLGISIVDIRFKAIPSFIMTGILFAIAVVNLSNFPYALLFTILALLLWEFNFIGGIADIKAMSIIGFTVSSHQETFIFIVIFMLFGVLYKILAKYILKERYEVAFLPVFFFSYLALKIIMQIIFGGSYL